LFAIIILFALLPAWFFYIGIQYANTIMVLDTPPVTVEQAEHISQARNLNQQ
jgi:hypothetical protein